ncbi:MAG: PAS domain S-box protein [Limisphaerales bacterium]
MSGSTEEKANSRERAVADLGQRLLAAADAFEALMNGKEDRLADLLNHARLLRDAQATLRGSEDRLSAIVESSHAAMISRTLDGIITEWNTGAEAIFGYSAAEAIGQPIALLLPPEHRDEPAQLLERIKRGERIDDFETVRIRKGGKRIHVSLIVSPIKDAAGEVVGTFTIGQDITVRLNLEAQLWQAHKMESIGILARGIAHNFNNILAVIQGYASLLMMARDLPASVTDQAQKISQATDRAANLTRQLLVFSQRQELRPEDLDLNGAVESMASMLQPILGEDITVRVIAKPDLAFIHADLAKLEQVLLNLAINARDAMPKGGQLFIATDEVVVDEDYTRRNPDAVVGRFVLLTVSDSGSGIAPENLPHVFDPFFTTKDVGKGIGLGLSSVYGIVKQHRGWIEIDTVPNKGTTVRTFFPSVERKVAVRPVLPAGPRPREGTETILLVEDETSLRGPVRSILERHGFRVIEAGSGVEALSVWKHRQDRVDLLLVDLVMPDGMSGQDLAEMLRVEAPHLRVLYTSGYSTEAARLHCPLVEGVNFLQKPYHADKLLQTVRSCLDTE